MANHGHGPGNPPPSSHNKARKLSYQPHKLTAAQRRHIEAGYAAQLEQLQTQLATLQVDSIRLKNRGMLLEQQLAIKNDQLWEVSGHVQVWGAHRGGCCVLSRVSRHTLHNSGNNTC